MPPRVRRTPWSRTGCLTCKRRHKKCDGQEPICDTCVRLGLECLPTDLFYSVTRTSKSSCLAEQRAPGDIDTVSRPAIALSQVNPSKPVARSCAVSKCTTLRRAHRPQGVFNPINTAGSTRVPESEDVVSLCLPTPWIRLAQFPTDKDITAGRELPLFQYYVEKLSALLVNATGNHNPLQDLVVPRAVESTVLRHAVLAISALHRSASMDMPDSACFEIQSDAIGYYVRSLSSLKDLIMQLSHSITIRGTNGLIPQPDVAMLEVVVLSSIFLCKFEIIKDGVRDWRRHLEGIDCLCNTLCERCWDSLMPEVMRFAQSFITYHKGVASLTEHAVISQGEPRCRVDSSEFIPERLCLTDSLYQEVDPYMGFSRPVIVLMRRLMGLLGLSLEGPTNLKLVQDEVLQIVEGLGYRCWTASHFVIPEGMSLETVSRLEHVALAYEHAAFATLHSVIDQLSERTGEEQSWDSVRTVLLPTEKGQSLTDCLAQIDKVPLGSPEEAGLLPVLFVVACETESLEQTQMALRRVAVLEAHVGLGNIRYTAALLREVWLRKSTLAHWHEWRALLASSNWDLILT